ncbi:prepilin-type N-terminal cleavage/methylation domain-containing protein, partial [Klebsiella pneumoniae]
MNRFGTKKGFSLLELILALGIGSAIALIKFQDMKIQQEDLVAKTAG